MRTLLRLPGFARLLSAYTLNELGWSVGTLALAVLVYRRTGSALGSAGFFLCSQAAPAVLSPPLVARMDRISPRVILPLLYWLEAVLFGLLAWMTQRFSLVPVLALALADGAVALTARSLAAAARTEILKPADLLREGNALTNTAFSICFMAGPLIGGGIVALGGTVTALIVNCALFAAMGATLLSDRLPAKAVHEGPTTGRLRAALAHVRRDRPIATLLTLQGIVYVFFTISVPVEVVYASHTLHAGPGGYGGLLSAWGGGAIIGSIGYARWRRQSARVLLTFTTAMMGIGFTVLTVAPGLVVALIGGALAGVANGVGSTAFQTEIQDRTPQSWMAMVYSLSQAVATVAPGLGIVLGGAITQVASTRVAFAVAAAGSLVFAVVIALVLTPARMGPVAGDPAGEPDGDGARDDDSAGVGGVGGAGEPESVPGARTLA